MRIFVTGGSGVLGRVLRPLLRADGHDIVAPGSRERDLFDSPAVRQAMLGVEAVFHLATRIPPPERVAEPGAWAENDRLRSQATPMLADAALAAGTGVFVLPSITFMYPEEGPADEDTPFGPGVNRLSSMVDAENAVRRFTTAGGRGVILRLGLLWGPGTGNDAPSHRYGATLHIEDAGSALRAALDLPSGVYNVVGDGERISNARFKAASGWQPRF
jgi:nucleoside-diphosphate-sugar epimerase